MKIPRIVFPLLAACMVGTAFGQSPYSQMTLLVGPQTYLSPAYAAHRVDPFAYLFYPGEPVMARIRVFNQGESPVTLVPMATVPQELFVIETTRDGLPIALQLRFAEGVARFFSGGEYPYSLDQSLRFDQSEGLEWHATLLNGSLPAGLYALTVHVRAVDQDSRPVAPNTPTFHFEVRTPTEEDRPEILVREADRHFRSGEYVEARAAVAELLRIHPRSAIAHMMRQRIASAEGNRAEVIAAIKQARTLLSTGQDELLLKFRSAESLREALQNLPIVEEPAR